jgi:hypothetical protein
MNTLPIHMMIPYTQYGYPSVAEASDYLLAPYEQQGSRFDSSRFSRSFRHNPFTLNMDQGAGLYNRKKQVEPLAMQMIGTAIDLYA